MFFIYLFLFCGFSVKRLYLVWLLLIKHNPGSFHGLQTLLDFENCYFKLFYDCLLWKWKGEKFFFSPQFDPRVPCFRLCSSCIHLTLKPVNMSWLSVNRPVIWARLSLLSGHQRDSAATGFLSFITWLGAGGDSALVLRLSSYRAHLCWLNSAAVQVAETRFRPSDGR